MGQEVDSKQAQNERYRIPKFCTRLIRLPAEGRADLILQCRTAERVSGRLFSVLSTAELADIVLVLGAQRSLSNDLSEKSLVALSDSL